MNRTDTSPAESSKSVRSREVLVHDEGVTDRARTAKTCTWIEASTNFIQGFRVQLNIFTVLLDDEPHTETSTQIKRAYDPLVCSEDRIKIQKPNGTAATNVNATCDRRSARVLLS